VLNDAISIYFADAAAGELGRLEERGGLRREHQTVPGKPLTLEQINDVWFDSQFLSGEGGRVQDAALSSGLHDSPLEEAGCEPSVLPSLGRLKPLILLVQDWMIEHSIGHSKHQRLTGPRQE
jgi:hypothetical protein